MSVVFSHAGIAMHGVDGYVAVLLFFSISGFYMALVLNEKYKTDVSTFYLARYLRLWPTYIVTFLIVTIFFRGLPEYRTIEIEIYTWFVSLTMFGYETLSWFGQNNNGPVWLSIAGGSVISGKAYGAIVSSTLFGQMWSVSVEIVFYLIAPFVARHPRRLIAVLAVAYATHLLLLYSIPANNPLRRTSAIGFIWIFLAGMMAYWIWIFLRERMTFGKAPVFVVLPFALAWAVWCLVQTRLGLRYNENAPWADAFILLFAVSIGPFFQMTRDIAWDRTVGEMSYGLYVAHFPIYLLFFRDDSGSWANALQLAGVSLIAAAALHFAVERNVDKFRRRLAARDSYSLVKMVTSRA